MPVFGHCVSGRANGYHFYSAVTIQGTARKAARKSFDFVARRFDSRERIHFLHIGKNAGTQLEHVAGQVNRASDRVRIVPHGHRVGLLDLPPGERYFFSVRSPETRFRSAFYSRKRKGRPRIHAEWSVYEREAFSEFEHANDLAEALFEGGERGHLALCAIKAISHCAMEQINWFEKAGFFFTLNPPVYIVRQERFEEDLAVLLSRLGFDGRVSLARDAVSAHRNDYSAVPPLSVKAKKNLFAWYRQDVEFYRQCEYWIAREQEGPAA